MIGLGQHAVLLRRKKTPHLFAFLILGGERQPLFGDQWEAFFHLRLRLMLLSKASAPTPAQVWHVVKAEAKRYWGLRLEREEAARGLSWRELLITAEGMARADQHVLGSDDQDTAALQKARFGYAFRRLVFLLASGPLYSPHGYPELLGFCPYCYRLAPRADERHLYGVLCSQHQARARDALGDKRSNRKYHQARRLQPELNRHWQAVRDETREAFEDLDLVSMEFPRWLRMYYPATAETYPDVLDLASLLTRSDDQVDCGRGLRKRMHIEFVECPELARTYLNRLEAWGRALRRDEKLDPRGGRRPGAGRRAKGADGRPADRD